MRILFDFSLNIAGIVQDDAENVPLGCFEIYVPKDINSKLSKTFAFARQKRSFNGKPAFLNNGKETELAFDNGKANEPVMEQASFSRLVSLKEAGSEWTLADVLDAKYTMLAQGKNYWYEEFIKDSIIDKSASIVNIGLGSVSIPSHQMLQLCPIKLSNAINRFTLYIEGAEGLDIQYSLDGIIFNNVNPQGVTLANPADTFIFKFTNSNADAPSVPIKAIAILF